MAYAVLRPSGSFQNLVLEGYAFGIVLLEPFCAASVVANTLMCSASLTCLFVLT